MEFYPPTVVRGHLVRAGGEGGLIPIRSLSIEFLAFSFSFLLSLYVFIGCPWVFIPDPHLETIYQVFHFLKLD